MMRRLSKNKKIITATVSSLLFVSLSMPLLGVTPISAEESFRTPNTSESAPIHIDLKNGSFEDPSLGTRTWEYLKAENTNDGTQRYVKGWNVLTVETPGDGSVQVHTPSIATGAVWSGSFVARAGRTNSFHDIIELKKVSGTENIRRIGEQAAELVAEYPSYVYQNFDTSPGQRLYYSFEERSENGILDTLQVYLTDGNTDMNRRDLVFEEDSTSGWTRHRGSYIVPEGQYLTSIGFFCNAGANTTVGTMLDAVEVVAGAYPVIQKNADKLMVDGGGSDEIIRYTLNIKNHGQISAANLSLKDMLPPNTVSVENVSCDTLDITHRVMGDYLYIDFNTEDRIASDAEINISYDVKLGRLDYDLYRIRTQASLNYSDFGYQDLFNSSASAYSNVYEQGVYRNTADVRLSTELLNPEDLDVYGAELKYRVKVENASNYPAVGFWLREYIPKYTNFNGVDDFGEYGFVNGKEHVTWFIERIEPHETKFFEYSVVLNYCVRGEVRPEAYSELTGRLDKPYYNTRINPGEGYYERGRNRE